MPITQNPNEAGWFYHAPAKRQEGTERADYAAPSQIPGIGYEDPTLYEKEEVRPVMFKETDTKYIQMAKLGGRKDLLCFDPSKYNVKTNEPRGYARNDWFYLEDNRLQDEQKKKEEAWDFLLPEYMVHKGYEASFQNPSTPPTRAGAPYYVEKHSVMDEGKSATDKTVKIPEVRRAGFGVRNEKPPAPVKNLPPREKPVRQTKKESNPLNIPTEVDEPTMMSKLLAGGYDRDWHIKKDEYESKKKADSKQKQQQNFESKGNSCLNSATNRRGAQNNSYNNSKDEVGELFKLNKFKNVPSKVDTHQNLQVHY